MNLDSLARRWRHQVIIADVYVYSFVRVLLPEIAVGFIIISQRTCAWK